MSNQKIIKVSSGDPAYSDLLLRQTVGHLGIWDDCTFEVNNNIEKCDWWFVLHGSGLVVAETCLCDPNHIVYVSMEPDEIMSKISHGFLNQFSRLILCDRAIKHSDIVYENWLTWWVGIIVSKNNKKHVFRPNVKIDYDQLSNMESGNKMNKISLIMSDKDISDGHKKRIAFVDKMMTLPISKYIDVFGHGFKPIPDKWSAIAPYKCHLVLENSVQKDYWSEKLADSFLGFSYPIYYGCPNIEDYFSRNSMSIIDIENFDESIVLLETIIDNDIDVKKSLAICSSRRKILNKYNIFSLMAKMAQNKATTYEKISLKTNIYFSDSFFKKIIRLLVKKVNKKYDNS